MRIALAQMRVLSTPIENLNKISKLVTEAVGQGVELVVLPEMCCCEYRSSAFVEYAMPDSSEFLRCISDLARKNKVIIVAGSVPELEGDKIYNTSFVFDEDGAIMAKHRKAHLFDINAGREITFRESDTLTAGNVFTSFDTKWGKIGLIICFDIRFPEFIKANSSDLNMIIVPASFNMKTGPAHWELLFRARAVDNQLFMAGCASANDEAAEYHSYGHSIITNPWGDVVGQCGTEEELIIADIDFSEVAAAREILPLYNE